MTRKEKFAQMTVEQLADALCDLMDMIGETHNLDACTACPGIVNDRCRKGHCGFIDWLSEEVE